MSIPQSDLGLPSEQEQLRQSPSVHAEDAGYHKSLKPRQIQMIAIGGAIGTGLFLGAGGRLAAAGPSLMLAYALCGVFAFLILRALGELVLHRPTTGSFVSYAREFFGEKAAFVSGWFYWVSWATTTVADITAAALYMNFFGNYVPWIGAVPQWLWALIALVAVLGLNLISVKVFGELEFWFAFVKVAALVAFLLIGTYFVVFGTPTGAPVGLQLIQENGGLFPTGLLPMIVLMQGVIFAYASIELVGTAAGETENPEKTIPKAINSVIFRIAVFYVGSVILLSLLLPHMSYEKGVSPFVTFFGSIGIQGIDVIMNLVVLTAALSSLNAGLYSTGRILRSMSVNGSAPKFAGRMNRAGVPYGGIALTAGVSLLGVPLNYLVPGEAFEIVLSVAAVGIIVAWATILLCQIQLKRWADKGRITRPAFRMIGAPYTGYISLIFLAAVLIMTFIDSPPTLLVTIAAVGLIVAGWFACRDRIKTIASERDPFTGVVPTLGRSHKQ
ncbi:L-asparagine permease [Pseudarthrobacter sp. PvP004]|uniref:amino acid permease n=1 Tax=Pseudarthrobacter sp. PvP004 TaxID=2817850 RepID=UPI001AE4D4F6|nr:amino acid permease [Pseudarthrobacter sp. PvP004]MBP2266361.1 L-asparagine permease [Pseudarthrobacter sp. PvP004]